MNLAMAAPTLRTNHIGTPHSELVDHGACCQLARRWLLSQHRSRSFRQTERQGMHAPVWLRRQFEWGPVQWPLSWCEAVRKKHIDCGVFAAFARELFQSQGFEVHPAQIMLAQPSTYTHHWQAKWAAIHQAINWIGDNSVYHEVVAVAKDHNSLIRIYDPTEGIWLDPDFSAGVNGVVGVCVHSPVAQNWGSGIVGQGKWVTL